MEHPPDAYGLRLFKRNGCTPAVAWIFRDVESLQAELAMERGRGAVGEPHDRHEPGSG